MLFLERVLKSRLFQKLLTSRVEPRPLAFPIVELILQRAI